MTSMANLPIARYAFTARVQQPLALPDYAGSLLRGQFGAALRHVACMTRAPTCPGCPLLQTCPYSRIFEAPPPPKGSHALQDFSSIPNPYIIEPPTPGARVLDADDRLVFHMVLVGHAAEQLALIIFALQRALAQGLTRARAPTDLMQVDWVDETGRAHLIWHIERPVLLPHRTKNHQDPCRSEFIPTGEQSSPPSARTNSALQNTEPISPQCDAPARQLTLNITTPLRLQSQGKPLGVGQLTPRSLVAAVARRTALLMEFHAGQATSCEGFCPATSANSTWGEAARHLTRLSEHLTDTQDLHWFDWTRYSSRQQQEMTLGGVLGQWTLHGAPEVLAEIQPWLWLGQWLHVGKNASMGLGGYRLQ
jgi:hypothetical protein